jgi:NADH-quinone oxidoreductase subunit G
LNTRREAKAGGSEIVKRVMPRQNEGVNEIWICDKGRFAYHYALSEDRLSQPQVRKDGELVPVSWEEAISTAAEGIKAAESDVVGVVGGRASNEDLFVFHQLLEGIGGKGYLNDFMAGGELVQQVGVGTGSNLGELGQGDVVMVIASDLIEEAPIWWLRVKQTVERGTKLVVANARDTRLDKYASTTLRYDFGSAAGYALGLLSSLSGEVKSPAWKPGSAEKEALKAIGDAKDLIIFFGGEGLDHAGSMSLSQSCASILSVTGHIGNPNNGLIPVWKNSNTQGAWDMGFEPAPSGVLAAMQDAGVIYVLAADPLGDYLVEKPEGSFLIVQELFPTETVKQADVIFPAQSFLEREGTLTSGERIVQRFYPAVKPLAGTLPDWKILVRLGEQLELQITGTSAAGIMETIAERVEDYSDISYHALRNPKPQWPVVGGDDLYFGGTSYKNKQGVGVHLKSATERGEEFKLVWTPVEPQDFGDELLIIPVTRLLDRTTTVTPSTLLHQRIHPPMLWLNADDFDRLGLEEGKEINLRLDGHVIRVPAMEGDGVPPGAALIARSSGLPVNTPAPGEITPVTE